jgi:hypothetical protein
MCRWCRANEGVCFLWTKNGPVAQDKSPFVVSLSNHERKMVSQNRNNLAVTEVKGRSIFLVYMRGEFLLLVFGARINAGFVGRNILDPPPIYF